MALSDHITPGEILTSGQLAQRLSTKGLTAAAARKVISRKNDPAVWVLPFNLPRRARLFTRRESGQTDDFYARLATVISERRPGLARTIRALLTRRVLLKADAQRLLAAPSRSKTSRTPTYRAEASALVDLGLCRIEGEGTEFERLTIHSLFGTPDSERHARAERVRQVVTTRLTRILTDHFRKQAVVSWDGSTHPTAGIVLFSDYAFSAFGFSWLDPLVRRAVGQKPKPTPVLFDVFSRECDVYDVEGLLHRLRHVGSNRNARLPLLGVIAGHTFTSEAWQAAKKGGLLTINLRQSYGKAALKALARMERLLGVAVSGDLFGETAAELDYHGLATDVEALHVHPHVAELRGLALEVVTALLLRAHGWEDVRLGLPVRFGTTTRDVDVIGKRCGEDEVYVVECKAAHEAKDLNPADVHKFFTETVPAVLKVRPHAKKCHAEIWTTGRVGDAARQKLESISFRQQVNPELRDRAQITALVPSTLKQCKRLIKTLSLPQ